MTRAAAGPGRSRGTARAGRGSTATFAASVSRSSRFRSAERPGRVADHPRPAADQRDRPAAVALELEQPEDRDEVADVERRPRTGRSRCSRRSAGRSRDGRQARRRRRGACPASRARRAASRARGAVAAEPGRARVTARLGRAVSTRPEEGLTTTPMLSCGPTCRPASRGASAIGALGTARRPRGSAAVRAVRHRDPDPPLRGLPRCRPGGLGRRSPPPTTTTARACPIPKDTLTNLDVRPADDVTDRTGKIELARLGELKREVVTFDEIPPELDRRDDRDRGQGLLVEPRLRPRRLRLGDARHARRPAPRRLDDHPAARPRPAPARRAPSTAAARSARSARSSSRSA